MKHLEETPWWICDADDENYCAYVDTDSNYFNAEPLLLHLYPEFESFSDEEKDEKLEGVALAYQDIITEHYDNLATDCFNVKQFDWFDKPHWLEMKTECVIRSAYFRATRRYAQWITKQEGIAKETLDIKGLEFMKANFPPILGDFFNDILQQVLKGEEKASIIDQIKVFKKQILGGEIPLDKLGNPTAVKKLEKYSGKSARAGEMFTEILKGAPAPVRAAIRYNDLLRLWQLDKKHNLITMADKVKWIYLKDNPYKIDALAYQQHDIPEKISDFLEAYADRKKVFDSILLNKLEGFFSDLQWSLDLNPYTNALSSFEI
jgi:DNA polymerase elongation subunit (family B)